MRVHGSPELPTLIYLPGIHGDWTLVTDFRAAVKGRVRFVEFSYPRTLTWSLDDYATAIADALAAHQITRGWLLGESFGSQVVWSLLACRHGHGGVGESHRAPAETGTPETGFHAQGIILAGGFGRHPALWGVRLTHTFSAHTPGQFQAICFRVFALYARQRHRRTPETLTNVLEFIRRRQDPLDQKAISHRLKLIAGFDPRPIAQETRIPVYSLAGLVDPIVPLPWVRGWLKRHCPGYRGGRTILLADHNVLGTAPHAAAEQVWDWMSRECPPQPKA